MSSVQNAFSLKLFMYMVHDFTHSMYIRIYASILRTYLYALRLFVFSSCNDLMISSISYATNKRAVTVCIHIIYQEIFGGNFFGNT